MRELRRRAPLTSKRLWAGAIAVVVVVADQITKLWARGELADGAVEVVPGVVQFRLTENSGSAFSLFQGAGPFLAIAAIAAAGLILVVVEQTTRRDEFAGMALILGGALGNLGDRIMRGDGFLDGAVTDFIDVTNWPTFNLADSSITLGAVLLLWAAIRTR